MKISIIIPVFNTEEYLRPCLDSILSQSYADYEVLLIDDGSSDESGSICDTYAQKDSRIQVFHKENGGVSSARNRGIDNARGEYIVFVDSDDLVTDGYLEHLMESDADMVVTGLCKFGARSEAILPPRRVDFGIGELPIHWNTPPDMNYLYCYPVAKRFRSSILREHRIRFDESLFFSEDMCFNMNYYVYAKSFTELPYADYRYRLMNITRDEKYMMSAAKLIKHYKCLETCFNSLYEIIGTDSLSFVRDNTNLRIIRKFYSFLINGGITQKEFVHNVKMFREKDWSGYMIGLLEGKKEKRIMRKAIRYSLLTYWIEIRLKNAICNVTRH